MMHCAVPVIQLYKLQNCLFLTGTVQTYAYLRHSYNVNKNALKPPFQSVPVVQKVASNY